MIIETSLFIAAAGPVAGWVLSVERRLSTMKTVMEKLDKFLDIAIEDKLRGSFYQGRGPAPLVPDPRRDLPTP